MSLFTGAVHRSFILTTLSARNCPVLNCIHTKAWNEIQIPVPWGHLAGKWWGDMNQRPLLAIHGWQDNCGTFDRLAPLLAKNVSLLAIDLPGQGYSSQLPPGIPYDAFNSVIIFRRIQKFYKWPCVAFLSHSMGSMLSFLFSSMFPNETELLIGVDAITPIGYDYDVFKKEYGKKLEDFLRYDDKNSQSEPPCFTYEELFQKYSDSFSANSVPKELIHHLFERGVSQSTKDPKLYYFNMDPRVKSRVFPKFLHHDLVEMAKNISCPMMNIKVTDTTYYESESKYFEKVEVLKKTSKEFKRVEVRGTHHVHLVAPERFIEDVNDFVARHHVPSRKSL